MKISLIIPAYNEEKYIGRCLESVQKYARGLYEVIVINNASTDSTSSIAQSFPGVRVVLEEKKGLTKARQRGFLEAKGDVLAYIDADTYISPEWFTILQKEFTNNPTTASLSGPYIYYDIPRYQQIMVSLYWNILGRIAYWITRQIVVGGNFAIRKETLVKMGGFDTSIEFYGEDTNIARRARMFGDVQFNFAFVIHTSGRRLAGQGLVKTAMIYVLNFLSETFIHKPATKKHRDIR